MTLKNGAKDAGLRVKCRLEKVPWTKPSTLPIRLRLGTPAGSTKLEFFSTALNATTPAYERVPLVQLEQFAIKRGFPLYALNCALNMYSGNRRILIQGAVSVAKTTKAKGVHSNTDILGK
eukprot:4649297-Amphidinium_carterae.1